MHKMTLQLLESISEIKKRQFFIEHRQDADSCTIQDIQRHVMEAAAALQEAETAEDILEAEQHYKSYRQECMWSLWQKSCLQAAWFWMWTGSKRRAARRAKPKASGDSKADVGMQLCQTSCKCMQTCMVACM